MSSLKHRPTVSSPNALADFSARVADLQTKADAGDVCAAAILSLFDLIVSKPETGDAQGDGATGEEDSNTRA